MYNTRGLGKQQKKQQWCTICFALIWLFLSEVCLPACRRTTPRTLQIWGLSWWSPPRTIGLLFWKRGEEWRSEREEEREKSSISKTNIRSLLMFRPVGGIQLKDSCDVDNIKQQKDSRNESLHTDIVTFLLLKVIIFFITAPPLTPQTFWIWSSSGTSPPHSAGSWPGWHPAPDRRSLPRARIASSALSHHGTPEHQSHDRPTV